MSRLGLRATAALRAAVNDSSSSSAAAAARPTPQFPPRTKPRWQNPPGVAPVEMPPEFPLLSKMAKYGHYLAVFGLISLTCYSSYCVGYNYYHVRKNRLEWEAKNPEKLAEIMAEIEAKKQAEAEVKAAKFGLLPPNSK